MARAAACGWFSALAQCSTRMCRPSSGWKALATSPAAKMSGSEDRSPASTTTPLPVSRPAASASWLFGVIPTPTITASASTWLPSAIRTPLARPPATEISSTWTPNRRSAPCWRCRSAKTCATSGPSTRSSGSSAASMTVTSAPAARAAAAVSSPIHPAPMTATRDAVWKAALIWSLSAARRR